MEPGSPSTDTTAVSRCLIGPRIARSWFRTLEGQESLGLFCLPRTVNNKKTRYQERDPQTLLLALTKATSWLRSLTPWPLCPCLCCRGDDEHLAEVTAWIKVICSEHMAGKLLHRKFSVTTGSHCCCCLLLVYHQNVANEKKNKNCIKWEFGTCQLGCP